MINKKDSNILRGVQASKLMGCSLSTLYRNVNAGLLPPPTRYGRQSVVWLSHEIEVVMLARICGYSANELKELVTNLISERQNY